MSDESPTISPTAKPESESPSLPQVEKKLDKFISELVPEEQRDQIKRTIHEFFMAVVERSGGPPKIDPETAKIVVASIDRDNQHKFEYLSQKQRDSAAASAREHDLKTVTHNDRMTLARPAVYAAIAMVIGTSAAGIWLAATGHETLGASILSGVFSALLGYLGGNRHWKSS